MLNKLNSICIIKILKKILKDRISLVNFLNINNLININVVQTTYNILYIV